MDMRTLGKRFRAAAHAFLADPNTAIGVAAGVEPEANDLEDENDLPEDDPTPEPELESQEVSVLVRQMRKVSVPGSKSFTVAKRLNVGPHKQGLSIGFVDGDFQSRLFGIVEENVPDAKIRQSRLVSALTGQEIAEAFGGKEIASVRLTHLHNFLKKADQTLHYLFFVKDNVGEVWLGSAYWRSGGLENWGFNLRPVVVLPTARAFKWIESDRVCILSYV